MAEQPTTRKKKKMKVSRTVNGEEVIVEIEVDDTGVKEEWGKNDQHRLLNKRTPRVDGPQKVTGAAVFSDDVRLPGMLYARILRAPHARAHVSNVNLAPALKMPGVVVAMKARPTVFYEGTPVAAVAAVSPEIAEDAIHAIEVKYEVLPHVVKTDDAIQVGAPAVYPHDQEVKNNTRADPAEGDADAVNAAFKDCPAVVEAEYRTPTIHHCCLEPHGMIVDYRGGDTATVYASTQGVFSVVGDAAAQLEIPQSCVTVITQHMGGGFGSKLHFGVEGQLACRLAKEANVPVKLMLTRHDEFLMAGNRSGSWQKIKAGAASDGKLQAMLAVQYRLGGIGNGTQAPQPFIYHVPLVYREMASIHTNVDSSRAMRAPGRPQASFAIECLLDELAYKLGIDPIEFRKSNVDDTVYHRQLDRAAKEVGWERRKAVAGAWPGTLKRGFGCACTAWGGGGGPLCIVHVAITRDGAVTASVGSQDLGTGTRTYVRAIVAEELGLQLDDVTEKIGDSSLGPANASGGSITTASLSPAVKDAAANARLEFAKLIAPILSAKPEQVSFSSGQVIANGKSIPWKQTCAVLPAAGISARVQWQANLASIGTHGAVCAEVEVDVETGRVQPIRMVHIQDLGLPLNRLAIESQINGGMIQGLGMALFEGRVMDGPLGVMLNPNFEDYKLPGCLEMPELVPIIDDQDDREAVVGMGEPPVIPGAAAIANAVFNACGVRVRDLPITPDKILMGLSQKG